MKKIFLAAIAFIGLAISCTTPEDCVEKWSLNDRAPGATNIFIDDKQFELSLQFSNWAGLAAEVYQSNIGGNFSVITEYRNFQTGSAAPEPYVALCIWDPTLPDTILDTTVVEVGLMRNRLYAMTTLGDTSFKVTNATAGSLRMARTGANVTVIATAGLDTVIASGPYSGMPRRIGFRMGTKDSTLISTGTTGVKISLFEVVTSNGSIRRDDFNCNSFYK
jgi:hypothetical protein